MCVCFFYLLSINQSTSICSPFFQYQFRSFTYIYSSLSPSSSLVCCVQMMKIVTPIVVLLLAGTHRYNEYFENFCSFSRIDGETIASFFWCAILHFLLLFPTRNNWVLSKEEKKQILTNHQSQVLFLSFKKSWPWSLINRIYTKCSLEFRFFSLFISRRCTKVLIKFTLLKILFVNIYFHLVDLIRRVDLIFFKFTLGGKGWRRRRRKKTTEMRKTFVSFDWARVGVYGRFVRFCFGCGNGCV